MDEDQRMNRRRFFRAGLGELLRPLLGALEPIERVVEQMARLEQPGVGPRPREGVGILKKSETWLRPPGAMGDQAFQATCSRGGECVKACPAQCIKIDPTGRNGNGAPYIDADAMACVVCDGLYCMQVCPSGALVPTAVGEIDMGTAVWNEGRCLRSHGEECSICVDHCPIGEVAIELKEGRINVKEAGCVGCGVCQHDCPTSPKSIVVTPRAARGIRLGAV